MRKGRPTKKKKRNISGLKNQNASLIPSYDSSPRSTSPAPQPIVPDSTRTNWEEEDAATGAGVNTDIVKPTRKHFKMLKMLPYYILMHAPLKLFVDSLIDLGVS